MEKKLLCQKKATTVNTLLPLNEKLPGIPAKLEMNHNVNVLEAKEWGKIYRW